MHRQLRKPLDEHHVNPVKAWLTDEQHDDLLALAKATDDTKSRVLRNALDYYLKHVKQQEQEPLSDTEIA